MSLDANYILVYDNLGYVEPTPMQKDIEYLTEEYGGEFLHFNGGNSIYWEKPKYTISEYDLMILCADQILERKDCELWEIIK